MSHDAGTVHRSKIDAVKKKLNKKSPRHGRDFFYCFQMKLFFDKLLCNDMAIVIDLNEVKTRCKF